MSDLAHQMKARDTEMVPRILVQGMFAVMLSSLALVSYARLTDRPLVGVVPDSPIAQSVSLRLTATREGTATVYDLGGTAVAHSDQDMNGFLDVVARAIALERTKRDLPLSAPITVNRREDGIIAIHDPTTDWTLDLIGYGKDNVAAFAKLLPAKE